MLLVSINLEQGLSRCGCCCQLCSASAREIDDSCWAQEAVPHGQASLCGQIGLKCACGNLHLCCPMWSTGKHCCFCERPQGFWCWCFVWLVVVARLHQKKTMCMRLGRNSCK